MAKIIIELSESKSCEECPFGLKCDELTLSDCPLLSLIYFGCIEDNKYTIKNVEFVK